MTEENDKSGSLVKYDPMRIHKAFTDEGEMTGLIAEAKTLALLHKPDITTAKGRKAA